jgi:hypothetical protein
MSLSSLALRLAAVEALRPTAALAENGPWPTIAAHHVYDAKIDQIDDIAAGTRAPVIAVYTEDATATSRQEGPPFEAQVDLCFELSVAQMMEDPDFPGEFAPAVPVTDAESEASLDLLESSIRFALIYGPTGRLFRTVSGNRIKSISSKPARSSEEVVRLAMRSMTMRIEISDDCFDLAPNAALTGVNALPEPLRSLIIALPDGSYGKAIGLALATAAPQSPVPARPWSLSSGFDFHVPSDPDDDPDVETSVTPPQGP